MGRFVSAVAVIITLCMAGLLAGCSHSQAVTTSTTTGPVPTIVSLSPGPVLDLEVGKTLNFTGTPRDSGATALTGTVSFQSSNTAVLTISTAGVACAGSLDSLSNPTVCTPGPVGVAQVTATDQGVSSAPTTVYVHQHIDSVTISAAPNQAPPTAPCFSAANTVLPTKAQSLNYQATVLSRGADITSTVGAITWQAVNTNVVTLKTATVAAPISGLLPGQTQATANVPGTTTVFASVDGTTSTPLPFTTCPVQSITLKVDNASSNTVIIPGSGSTTITATIKDTQGTPITGGFLTWCSSDPASVLVGGTNCATGTSISMTATAQAAGGGAAIIASCTPPNCNIGFVPVRPVYPPTPVVMTISGAASSTSATTNVWATSTGCGTLDGCISLIAHITGTGGTATTPSNTLSVAATLPATPNSLVFDPKGSRAYLGTDRGDLGTKGVMVLNASGGTATQFTSAVGKVLAVSPDGTGAIVSDTVETPNQVYVFTCGGPGSGTCSGTSSVALNITGATAAAFSPDGLKAYILAGSTLYVYSQISPLQTIALATPVSAVSFLADGAFAYLTGGSPAVTTRRTCDGAVANDMSGNPQTVTTAGTPVFLKALPDGAHLLAVDPPGIDIVAVTNIDTTSTDNSNPGCAPATAPLPAGPVLSNSVSSVNLAQGSFIPTQLIVSSDGSTAYLLTSNRGGVLVFDIRSRTTSSIQLTGNVLPLQASLTPDGTALYVAASDGMVHVLNTITANDIQQLSIPQDPAHLLSGLCENVAFPIQTAINITAATQNGSNTTYTYTLTSGQGLQLDASIFIQGMGNAGNNGTFTIAALGAGTFTVVNPSGTTASNQTGAGTLSFNCNPDLIAVAP